jgi:hypothetical protein
MLRISLGIPDRLLQLIACFGEILAGLFIRVMQFLAQFGLRFFQLLPRFLLRVAALGSRAIFIRMAACRSCNQPQNDADGSHPPLHARLLLLPLPV